MLSLCATLLALALTAGAATARASSSCGLLTAAGHSWIIVAKGVSCSSAKRLVRGFATRTARLRSGQTVVVHNVPGGFTCVLASRGKPGGSSNSTPPR